jgi:DNA-binding NarL/FixJ family response regulator
MSVRVAVVDPLPMYARGLAATLADEGHAADMPTDVIAWVREPGPLAILLSVADDVDWALLAEILDVRPDAVVVVVMPHADADMYARAVSAGAVGVLPRDAPAVVVGDVIRAALDRRSTLPVDVLRTLVAGRQPGGHAGPLSEAEVAWLRQLAEGSTVARLAEHVGYSERMMFRLLSDVYARLGAGNRTRAIMRARDEGWL